MGKVLKFSFFVKLEKFINKFDGNKDWNMLDVGVLLLCVGMLGFVLMM